MRERESEREHEKERERERESARERARERERERERARARARERERKRERARERERNRWGVYVRVCVCVCVCVFVDYVHESERASESGTRKERAKRVLARERQCLCVRLHVLWPVSDTSMTVLYVALPFRESRSSRGFAASGDGSAMRRLRSFSDTLERAVMPPGLPSRGSSGGAPKPNIVMFFLAVLCKAHTVDRLQAHTVDRLHPHDEEYWQCGF